MIRAAGFLSSEILANDSLCERHSVRLTITASVKVNNKLARDSQVIHPGLLCGSSLASSTAARTNIKRDD